MILTELDIFGITQSNESAILACMLLGEPALLVGPPGTAKTELLDCIGRALRESDKRLYPNEPEKWFSHQTYDTSKLNPEDLIGFPNPKSLIDGKMDYIRLPSTIWGKTMVTFDEINRCEKSRQSNLFEIIRSRRINGIPTDNKFIFSAMNPLGDTGTQEMSEALADRHIFYIWFSNFNHLEESHKISITNRIGNNEAIGINYWTSADNTKEIVCNKKLADVGDRIKQILYSAVPIYQKLESSIGENITKMIVNVFNVISEEAKKKDSKIKLELSGRRAGMIKRGLIALRAIDLAKTNIYEYSSPTLEGTLTNGIIMGMPTGIASKTTPDGIAKIKNLITETVSTYYKCFFSNDPGADLLYTISYTKNPLTKIGLILDNKISNLTNIKLWEDIYEANKGTELEAILGILDEQISILPNEVSAKLDKDLINRTKKNTSVKIEEPYNQHKEIINNTIAKYKAYPVLQFCAIQAINYISRIGRNHSNTEIITNIYEINKILESIKKNHFLPTNTQPNVDQKNSSKDPQELVNSIHNSTIILPKTTTV